MCCFARNSCWLMLFMLLLKIFLERGRGIDCRASCLYCRLAKIFFELTLIDNQLSLIVFIILDRAYFPSPLSKNHPYYCTIQKKVVPLPPN